MQYSDNKSNVTNCLYNDNALKKIKDNQKNIKDKYTRPQTKDISSKDVRRKERDIKRSKYLINELSFSELRGYI